MNRLAGWALAFLVVIVIIQSLRGAAAARRADAWEVRAKVAMAQSDSVLKWSDSLLGAQAQRSDSLLAVQAALAGGWMIEAKRLGGVVAQLTAALPQVPATAPDTCTPWVIRAAALQVILDSAKAQSHASEVASVIWRDSVVTIATAAKDTARTLARDLASALRLADSLLKTHPRQARQRLAVVLDGRIGSDRSVEGSAGLGVALKGGLAYLARVQGSNGSRVDVGWRKSLKVF